MKKDEKAIKALELLKDWSNYLLITTVAALGWITSDGANFATPDLKVWSVIALGLSIVFAIFTLGLIPVVTQEVEDDGISIYKITPEFTLLWVIVKIDSIRLKHVCWPQHLLFIVGIFLYVIGTQFSIDTSPRGAR